MTPEELTQFTTVQQVVLTRHETEMAEIWGILTETARRQEETARRQEASNERLDRLEQLAEAHAQQQAASSQRLDRIEHLAEVSRQDIAVLTASIQELRNLVADYLHGRSQA